MVVFRLESTPKRLKPLTHVGASHGKKVPMVGFLVPLIPTRGSTLIKHSRTRISEPETLDQSSYCKDFKEIHLCSQHVPACIE